LSDLFAFKVNIGVNIVSYFLDQILLYYTYSVPQKNRKVFLGCYVLKTDGKIFTRHPENRRGRNFWEKFLDENLANMGDPRMHAESTDSWGILKIEKPKMKNLILQSIHPESANSLGIFTK
jgi:hypothetical protein